MLRGQIASMIAGTVFLFIGLAACAIAAIRRRQGVRIFVWLGLWSAIYGALELFPSPAVVAVAPRWYQTSIPYLSTTMQYLVVVAAGLAFRELTRGIVRSFLQAVIVCGLAIDVAATAYRFTAGLMDKFVLANNLLAVCALVVLTTVVAAPKLSQRYLVLPDRGVLAVGTLVFSIQALYVNLMNFLGRPASSLVGDLGFAILLFSFGYVALQMVLGNERRLLSVERELAIAREIQASILPSSVPEIDHLRISAAYRPMTEVGGDFYEFIAVDRKRIGMLVADVSGHGVPAALIASMIKVGMQTVVGSAQDPAAVLRGLDRLLSGQLRGQFVSAAYLWVDTENRRALYSAAGHPPLLRWRQGKLERIESNGLLFGVIPESDSYPVCSLPILPGDRFLLSTDGVTEPENTRGDAFGDARLEQVLRANQGRLASELSDELLSEIQRWQPASIPQQDDMTLIVVDVISPMAS